MHETGQPIPAGSYTVSFFTTSSRVKEPSFNEIILRLSVSYFLVIFPITYHTIIHWLESKNKSTSPEVVLLHSCQTKRNSQHFLGLSLPSSFTLAGARSNCHLKYIFFENLIDFKLAENKSPPFFVKQHWLFLLLPELGPGQAAKAHRIDTVVAPPKPKNSFPLP